MAGLFRVIVELALNLHKLVHTPQGCTAWPWKRPFIIANFSLTILKSSVEQTAVNFSIKAVYQLYVVTQMHRLQNYVSFSHAAQLPELLFKQAKRIFCAYCCHVFAKVLQLDCFVGPHH